MRWSLLMMALLVACARANADDARSTEVALCEVVKNPRQYDGKEITIRATWRYGFEVSDLYCYACWQECSVWVEFQSDLKGKRRLPGGKTGTVNVAFRGIFIAGDGRHGHLNGYRYKFEVSEVLAARRVTKSYELPSALPPAVRRSICQE